MEFRVGRSAVAIVSAVAASVIAAPVLAGGFAVREQSTSAQGSSFAGSAAGFDLSSMFWNPAAVTTKNGFNTEAHAAIIVGDSEIDLGADGNSGNIAQGALVPSSYFNYQLSDRLFIGMSINSPFGLTTKPDNLSYGGIALAKASKLFTLNAAPTVGYKVMPGVSVAAGVQVQYIDARLNSIPPGTGSGVEVSGDDIGFGFTAGVLLEPTSTTKIGLGFRSKISHRVEGSLSVNGTTQADIFADADLPELVTLSLRQQVSPTLTLLGTVEWTNWSRVKELVFIDKSTGAQATVGGSPVEESLNYEDGWFFSLGLEYQYNPHTLLRAGVAYEISPIRTDEDRGFRIPDNDRIWLSVGTTYKWSETISVDTAFTHIFVEDGGIEEGPLSGSTQAHAEKISTW
ncbi:MAG: outer membrane protein transport protein, partial [Pseudomonadota bacterium]